MENESIDVITVTLSVSYRLLHIVALCINELQAVQFLCVNLFVIEHLPSNSDTAIA